MALVGPYALVVSNGVLNNSSDVFAILDPDVGGAATFTVPCSANGLDPVTDWAALTRLEEATYNALKPGGMTVPAFKSYVDEMQILRGREAVGSITAFKNNVRISPTPILDPPDGFIAYLASIGLQRVETEAAIAAANQQRNRGKPS